MICYTREKKQVIRGWPTTASSLEAEQESGNIHKTRPTATLNEPSPQGLSSGSGPRRQDTTLGVQMLRLVDLMDFVQPTPHDSPLLGGHTLGSDEGRPHFNELTNLYTQLSNRVLALENSKTAQDLVIQKLKKRVKRLEKALRARTPGMKLFKIGTSRRKGLITQNVIQTGRKSNKTKPMLMIVTLMCLMMQWRMLKVVVLLNKLLLLGIHSINVSTAGPSNVSAAGPSTRSAWIFLKMI
ncbi:hypothetical protein Tco_1095779 [Tanacetum coccineum]